MVARMKSVHNHGEVGRASQPATSVRNMRRREKGAAQIVYHLPAAECRHPDAAVVFS